MGSCLTRCFRQSVKCSQGSWTFLFMADTLYIVGFWNITIAAALVTGLISHILLDIITKHGTPIFYPFSKTNFVVLSDKRRVKTGTNLDKAVFLALLCLLIPILIFISHSSDGFPFQQSFISTTTNSERAVQ